jgi:hypothetical protein
VAFALSFLLVFASSAIVARALGRSFGENFWLFISTVALQFGAVGSATSLFGHLEPWSWLLGQAILCALLLPVSFRGQGPGLTLSAVAPGQRGWLLSCVAIAALITLSALKVWRVPLCGFDERMYHASRVLYWIQNHSLLPYPTQNDRQVVFPFGSELFFLWPILFTKTELIGRLVFWLAYPASAIGLFLLVRELGGGAGLSLLTVLAFVSTPIVIASSLGLKPELWLTVFALGTAFWAVRAFSTRNASDHALLSIGIFSMLTVNVKWTGLALVPAVLLLVFWRSGDRLRNAGRVLGGMAVGLLLSGLAVTVSSNLARYGRLTGPEAFGRVHESTGGPRESYVNAVRLSFTLLELPLVPESRFRRTLSRRGNALVAWLGAGTSPEELQEGWRGPYAWELPREARWYSLPGLLWLPLLGVGLGILVRDLFAFPGLLRPVSMVVSLEALFVGGIVFGLHWMTVSGVPERFLVAPFALGLATHALILGRLLAGPRARALACLALAFIAFVALSRQAEAVLPRLETEVPTARQDAPFAEPLAWIRPGSRILFFGRQSARDYPLFGPRSHYPNVVVPWGKAAFEPGRLRAIVSLRRVTHILIEDDRHLSLQWEPPIETAGLVAWLAGQADFWEIPQKTKLMRLFEVPEAMNALGLTRGEGSTPESLALPDDPELDRQP